MIPPIQTSGSRVSPKPEKVFPKVEKVLPKPEPDPIPAKVLPKVEKVSHKAEKPISKSPEPSERKPEAPGRFECKCGHHTCNKFYDTEKEMYLHQLRVNTALLAKLKTRAEPRAPRAPRAPKPDYENLRSEAERLAREAEETIDLAKKYLKEGKASEKKTEVSYERTPEAPGRFECKCGYHTCNKFYDTAQEKKTHLAYVKLAKGASEALKKGKARNEVPWDDPRENIEWVNGKVKDWDKNEEQNILKVCPKCNRQAKTEKEIQDYFGYRIMGSASRPQSWCRACRTDKETSTDKKRNHGINFGTISATKQNVMVYLKKQQPVTPDQMYEYGFSTKSMDILLELEKEGKVKYVKNKWMLSNYLQK